MAPENNQIPPLLVIAGPTACGKTETAAIIAEKLGTEIISADSVQVYKQFDIGSAKPPESILKRVRHHLISVAEPEEDFTVGRFRDEADKIAASLWRQEKVPLIAGGTGLYIKAITEGLHCGVKVSPEVEAEIDAIEAREGQAGLYARAEQADPDWMKAVHPNDKFRVRRALGVFLTSGKMMSELYSENPNKPQWDALVAVINPDRQTLYGRIENRVDAMLAEGWRDEVKSLVEKGYNDRVKPMRALGYRTLLAELEGLVSPAETPEIIKRETRNFAKRQITWFKKVENALYIPAGESGTPASIASAITGHPRAVEFFGRHGVRI